MKIHEAHHHVFVFYCPGCKEPHTIHGPESKTVNGWKWNGSYDKPTFSPSYLVKAPPPRCHSFIENGMIRFLSDCEHSLAGQTVEIPDWQGWGMWKEPGE